MTIVDSSQESPNVSIIIPFYNEVENLPTLHEDVLRVMEPLDIQFEIIFIDDGSNDGGGDFIRDKASADVRVKLVRFSRNFGQTAAMAAGFMYANGDVYVAMDADNQNDPADIPRLLSKLDEGYDIVSGWRERRRDKFFTRRLPSKIANFIISKVTGVKLRDYGCSLKAYRSKYMDSIALYGEMHRFIPAYLAMVGARLAEISVNHRSRTMGKSKYSLSRVFKVMMDLITVKFFSSYATKPNYLFGGIGSLLCITGIFSAIEVIVEKTVAGTYAHNNPFLLLAVFLFLLGIQFFLMGIIAEVMTRIYHESQGKKTYFVAETINLAEK